MKIEDKQLLLKDLCSRLPYGVKVEVDQDKLQNYDSFWNNWNFNEEPQEIDGVNIYGVTFGCMDMSDGAIPFEFIKPYLFPMSSMTKEQKEEFDTKSLELQLKVLEDEIMYEKATEFEVDFYNKHHLDWRGLIPMGLAIDATGLNIY